jgi:hypothetical protein
MKRRERGQQGGRDENRLKEIEKMTTEKCERIHRKVFER